MDAIQAARELGKAIQADERYIKMALANQKSEEDKELQDLIGDFNRQRVALNAELQKKEKDQGKIAELDTALKGMYQRIFENGNMAAFTAARGEFEQIISLVNQIITGSAAGEDPETIQFKESCGGSCDSCAGCG